MLRPIWEREIGTIICETPGYKKIVLKDSNLSHPGIHIHFFSESSAEQVRLMAYLAYA